MRADGAVSSAANLASDAHLCWVYDEPECFTAAGRQYLADGLARGDRLFCVGSGAVEAVRAGVGGYGYDELVGDGRLLVLPVDEAYTGDTPLDPEAQLAFYDALTRDALADGYHGLRVLAELTDLVRDDGHCAALARWEHLADDYMASGTGMTALCAYRRGAIGDAAATAIESVHPLVHARDGSAPFRVFFDHERIALAGVVDAFGAERLLDTLVTSHVDAPAVTLDLGRLEFVDVRGCTVLARYATALERSDRELRLVGAPPLFRRVWQVLGYDAIGNTTVSEARA